MFDPALEATLSYDLDFMAANHAVVRALAGGAQVAPVVKADAYGMGVGPIARRLWREGARSFFVARVAEGEELRIALGAERPAQVMVFDGCPPGAAARLGASDLTPVLNSPGEIAAWSDHACRLARMLPAILQIDTGMNRLGLTPAEAMLLAADPAAITGLDLNLVMSHLACAEEPDHPMNAAQRDAFVALRVLFPGARASLANSAAVWLGAGFHHDLVRAGKALHGAGPFGRTEPALRTAATLTAPILQVRIVQPGESVGYGGAWTATSPQRIAIIAAGYADGVLRSRGAEAYGWFEGRPRRFVGRISMDLIALDVTGCDRAQVGARVELFGPNLPLDDAARQSGTVAYELLTRIAPRVRRLYTGEET